MARLHCRHRAIEVRLLYLGTTTTTLDRALRYWDVLSVLTLIPLWKCGAEFVNPARRCSFAACERDISPAPSAFDGALAGIAKPNFALVGLVGGSALPMALATVRGSN